MTSSFHESPWIPVGIVGAGPVGLFAAFACGMQGLSCGLMDILGAPGGQCAHLYGEKMIYDIPGHVAITGQDLTNALCAQIEPFSPQWFLGHHVVSMEKTPEGFVVQVRQGNEEKYLKYRALFLCSGLGSFMPKKPPLENIQEFENISVFYNVTQKEMFSQKEVLIAGGGDSALDWALHLAPVAKKIHLVHRREQFRAQPHLLDAVEPLKERGQLVVHAPYQLKALKGQEGQLEAVVLSHGKTEEEKILPVNAMVCCFGLEHNNEGLSSWPLWRQAPLGLSALGLENSDPENENFPYNPKDGIPINPTTAQTAIEGIYAAGDGVSYNHKKKLIATGFAEAYQGAYHIRHYLFPHEIQRFVHSTTQGVKKL